MTRALLFFSSLFLSLQVPAQDSKMSVELSYPLLAIDTNFLGTNFNGLIDAGFDYRFAEAQPFTFGGSLNLGILRSNGFGPLFDEDIDVFRTTVVTIQPRVFTEFTIEALPIIHPAVGLGYTIISFDNSIRLNQFGDPNQSTTRSGFNVNAGVMVDITNRLLAHVQYDFIQLSSPNQIEVPNTKFNKNVNILKLGLGYRL